MAVVSSGCWSVVADGGAEAAPSGYARSSELQGGTTKGADALPASIFSK